MDNKSKIFVLFLMGLWLCHNQAWAQTHISYEQWKARQERHDLRLRDQPSKATFQQRVVQVDKMTPLAVMTVAKTPQVLGEQLRVNVNTATLQELTAKLDGIGRTKAQAILAYRQQHGAFKKVDDLLNVKGIGVKTLEKNRDRIALK